MGKKPGWLRRIFGGKKPNDSSPKTSSTIDEKNKCSNSTKNNNPESFYTTNTIDADNKHAIAVAAATAAVAEAAVAAAKAAAEVVRLTSGSGRCAPTAYISRTFRIGEVEAAVKIQSAFRAYLARRALRALKALVKLQALVRGHIVRKQTADMLRRMQALARVQARARESRARMSESYLSSKFSLYHHPGPSSPIKYQRQLHVNSAKFDNSSLLKRCGSNSNKRDLGQNKAHIGSNSSLKPYADDEKTDRILEVDTWRPRLDAKQINRSFQTPNHVFDSHHYDRPFIPFDSPSRYSTKARYHVPDIYYREASSLSSLKFPTEADEATLWTDEYSPTLFSSSSRPGSSLRRRPFSPTRSECSRSFYSGCLNYPHYMSNTESYRAKVRSQSAPRQRIELFEKYGSTRSSVHGFPDPMTSSHGGSTLAEFRNKVYYQDSTR